MSSQLTERVFTVISIVTPSRSSGENTPGSNLDSCGICAQFSTGFIIKSIRRTVLALTRVERVVETAQAFLQYVHILYYEYLTVFLSKYSGIIKVSCSLLDEIFREKSSFMNSEIFILYRDI